jgi:hypothetical protein
MRPGQNKRMRGRNNRKGPNPLTRTYESNGPDVKIRGTAHHVAEKYLQLARDAQSSGDPVMAESYLQHAEHYFRLIAAAQAAQQQAQMGYTRAPGEAEAEDFDDDDDLGGLPDRFASPAERFPQNYQPNQQPMAPQPGQPQPQPYMGQGGFGGDRPPQGQQPQPYQGERQDRGDRQPRQDRPYQDRNNGQNRFNNNRDNRDNRDNRQQRDNRPPREFRNEQRPQQQPMPPMGEDVAQPGLPAFITSPVRVPVSEQTPQPDIAMASVPASAPMQPDLPQEGGEGGGYHLRPRRRRRPRAEGEAGDAPQTGEAPVAE